MSYLGQSQLLSGTCANSCAHTGLSGLPWRSSLTVTLQCHGQEEVWGLKNNFFPLHLSPQTGSCFHCTSEQMLGLGGRVNA